MGDATGDAPEPEPASQGCHDSDPDTDGWLGDFAREPAVFSVFRIGPNNGGHPLVPAEYRVCCNDGAGPREICRFSDEPDPVPEWFGAWRGDEWCEWILEKTRALIAEPDNK
ncbi:hypothetical protein K3N28_07440 [Glycomyces sp. TRM65418]|uniref:hypothetical protein n=1 Tax=Glycomyces sp. TRM65418 TaxID=2867006 RepID=UPI001CE64778|nr:hypothetical protein [Glycomyces sp. TRM65418]MCC3762904.1 hypothetical protein [Glycomyces sp. TRM65418]QZD56929.1 hypothetical protein K3N28_07390 [Glycomyces sp. TRM65418]